MELKEGSVKANGNIMICVLEKQKPHLDRGKWVGFRIERTSSKIVKKETESPRRVTGLSAMRKGHHKLSRSVGVDQGERSSSRNDSAQRAQNRIEVV